MFLQCLVTVLCAASIGIGYLVLTTAIKARQALEDYKKKNSGLPMLEDANFLKANHGVEFHLGRNVANKMTKWHRQYGNTFGFVYGTRPCASTIDLDLIKLIVLDEAQTNTNRMPFYTAVPEFEKDEIFMAEGEQWRRIRRVFGPALRKFKMPNMINEIETSVSKFVESLENRLARSSLNKIKIELDDLIHRFSQDVVFRCLYKQSNLIDYEQDECKIVREVDEALKGPVTKPLIIKLCLVFPILTPLFDWIIKNLTQMGEWQYSIMGFIRDQTELALKARKQLQDKSATRAADFDEDNFRLNDGTQFKRFVVDYIIDHYLDGKLTRQEYLNSSFLMFSAADKTVCDAMIHAIYYVSIHQNVQEKLRNSIVSSGAESEYLLWVLNEAMRLNPPANIGCSRTVMRDIKLAQGYVLPAGTYVHTPVYTIHREKRFWGQDADEFKPERWANSAQFHPMQFIAFGAGRRSCPGKDLAYFEMKTLLASLLTRYKFEAKEKEDICIFDSPYTLYTLPNSPTYVQVTKLNAL